MRATKWPVYDDPCVLWLMRLSKAALADCVVDLLRTTGLHSADDHITVEAAEDRLKPVLLMRAERRNERWKTH
jgi:hypothetical protein